MSPVIPHGGEYNSPWGIFYPEMENLYLLMRKQPMGSVYQQPVLFKAKRDKKTKDTAGTEPFSQLRQRGVLGQIPRNDTEENGSAINALATTPDNPSSDPRTHAVEESKSPKAVL